MASVALRNTDLAKGFSLHLVPGGSEVAGQVTLDNCGYDFTTETHRVARRQYGMVDSALADTGLQNELVAYDTAAHAAAAAAQWHTAAATCPHTPVHSKVAGEPDFTYKISSNKLNVATFPAKLNVVTTERGTASGKHMLYNVSILQVQGRYLDAVYLTEDTPLTTADTTVAESLAVATGRRLVTLK